MSDTTSDTTRRTLRLPQAESRFIERQAAANATSSNAEIVRAVRERMERERETTRSAAGGRMRHARA